MMEFDPTVARSWIDEACLPFWLEHGVDHEYGGFVEHLTPTGRNAHAPFKRTRVIARQIYVFAHAALRGRPEAEAISRSGSDYLIKHAFLGEGEGWARALDERGKVLDTTPDLYDLAFVLFALGWRFRVSQDPALSDLGIRTVRFIKRKLAHPSGLGFVAELGRSQPSLQNPHMHLLEACLIWIRAGVDVEFKELAAHLLDLFTEKFFDGTVLREYFDDSWSPMADDSGRLVEPGHQFEWAWILQQYQNLLGVELTDTARRLADFAEMFGVSPEGVTYSTIRDDGTPLDRGSRVWPNTERIKAAVALMRLLGRDPQPWFSQSTKVLFESFFEPAPAGTWVDAINADLTTRVDRITSSSLYHIYLAFAEMFDAVEEDFQPIRLMGLGH